MDRYLRLAEAERVVGFKKSSLYSLFAANKFPRAIRIGRRSVRWRESDIVAWMEQLGGRLASIIFRNITLS